MENIQGDISVAMTSYNGAHYIEEQLNSIFNQTVKPSEVIICDDGSTDDTIAILTKYHEKGLITLYANVKQLGVIENFKQAVSMCKQNNYIVLADQDDYWLPNKIELQYAALRSIEASDLPSIVYSDLTLVDQNLNVIDDSFMNTLNIKPEKESLKSLMYGNFITGCTIMFNHCMREHFLKMPKDIYMHDAWIGFIAFTFGRNYYVDEKLVLYRQHGKNVTFETNRSVSILAKTLTNIKSLFLKNNFLETNLQLAKLFLVQYGNIIEKSDHSLLDKFLNLDKKPFAIKKVKSFLSRRYRYLNL